MTRRFGRAPDAKVAPGAGRALSALLIAVALLGGASAGAGERATPSSPPALTGAVETSPVSARRRPALDEVTRPPAFSRATVLRLNAIVRRSLDAIEDYDRGRAIDADQGAPEKRVALIARDRLRWLAALDARAQAAQEEMGVAAAELRRSGEPYNATLLAGMITFVDRVARELGEATGRLGDELEAAGVETPTSNAPETDPST